MIRHVCADCGARFHATDSWLRHWCSEAQARLDREAADRRVDRPTVPGQRAPDNEG